MHSDQFDFFELCEKNNIGLLEGKPFIHRLNMPNNNEKYICLTFDDGPSPLHTPEILDVLQKYDVQATFFVVGEFVGWFPEIAERIVKEGHEVGNHTFSHPRLTELSLPEVKAEIMKAEQMIQTTLQTGCKWFRPPYGIFSSEIIKAAEELDYRFLLWSDNILLYDWELPGVDVLVDKLLTKTTSGDIVLLHDAGGDRTQTIAALDQALPILQSRNYKFLTLSDAMRLSNSSAQTFTAF